MKNTVVLCYIEQFFQYMVFNIFEQKIAIYFIVFRLIRERGWADTSGYIITPQPPRPKTNNYWQFCILRPLLVMAHVISAFFWMAQSQLNEMNSLPKLYIPSMYYKHGWWVEVLLSLGV